METSHKLKSYVSQATLMMLSPLLRHGTACKLECLDDVFLWSDDKDNPRDSVGRSMDVLELKATPETAEAFGSETEGNRPLCSKFPCPIGRFSTGLLPGNEITPDPTAVGYNDIIANPLLLLVSEDAGCTRRGWGISWGWICSSTGFAET